MLCLRSSVVDRVLGLRDVCQLDRAKMTEEIGEECFEVHRGEAG